MMGCPICGSQGHTGAECMATPYYHIGDQMVDVDTPKIVEVQIRADGAVVWVNVDGVCRFRASGVTTLVINDERAGLTRSNADADDYLP